MKKKTKYVSATAVSLSAITGVTLACCTVHHLPKGRKTKEGDKKI